MPEEEKEYEVESVTQARVDKKGRKKIWKYRVRWKGYGLDDDTWEPVESFEGSEDIISKFWERANTGGRDYHNLALFKIGEEFLTTGPPRRKRKSKPDITLSPDASGSKTTEPTPESEKRKRSASTVEDLENRPNKRHREQSDSSPIRVRTKIPLPGRSKNRISHLNPPESTHTTVLPPRRRSPSLGEIIPASDEENEIIPLDVSPDQTNFQNDSLGEAVMTLASETMIHQVTEQDNARPPDEPDPLLDDIGLDYRPILPAHRARAANPRVKVIEPPSVSPEGAISVKARLMGSHSVPAPSMREDPRAHSTRTTPASGSKPGPGRSSSGFITKKTTKNRSSVLTAEKGSLKTVKGMYRKPEEKRIQNKAQDDASINDENDSLFGGDEPDEDPSSIVNPPAPPTAGELLELAGLDVEKAEELPDFDDALPLNPQPDLYTAQNQAVSESNQNPIPDTGLEFPDKEQVKSTLQQSLDLAKDKLFPTGATMLSGLNAVWKRSTIFGPLGLGSMSQSKLVPGTPSTQSSQITPFSLNLDSSVVIPVVLTDAPPSNPGSPSLEFIVANDGPSGKFYNESAALALLNTLRTGGPSAKIVLDPIANDDQQQTFRRFHSRLKSGELFVALAGVEVLAFCSASNALLAQRLNLPPFLLEQPEDLLVSRVIIEHYSAYADAAVDADSRRWSQYCLEPEAS